MPFPAADILRQYLLDENIAEQPSSVAGGQGADWLVTTGGLTTGGGDFVVSLTDAGGAYYGRQMRTGERNLNPVVHVAIRSRDYPTGLEKGQQIETLLDGIGVLAGGVPNWPVVALGSGSYELINGRVTVPTQKIGMEEQNRRHVFTLNVALTIRAA